MDVRKVIKQIYTHRPTRRALIVGLIFTIYLILLGNRFSHIHGVVLDADGAPVAGACVRYETTTVLLPTILEYPLAWMVGRRITIELNRSAVSDSSGNFSALIFGDDIGLRKLEHPRYAALDTRWSTGGRPMWLGGVNVSGRLDDREPLIKATAGKPLVIPVVVREKLDDWPKTGVPASSAMAEALTSQERSLLAEIDKIAWDEVQGVMPRAKLRDRWLAVLSRLSPSTLSRLAQATDRPVTRWALLEIARRSKIRGLESVALAAMGDNIESEYSAWRYLAWWGDAGQAAPAIARTKPRDRQGLDTVAFAAAYLARTISPPDRATLVAAFNHAFPPSFPPSDPLHLPPFASVDTTIESFDNLMKQNPIDSSKLLGYFLEYAGGRTTDNQGSLISRQVVLVSHSSDPRFATSEILKYITMVEKESLSKRVDLVVTSPMVWEVVAMHGDPVPDKIALKLPICGLRLANVPEPTTAPATP